MNGFQQQTFLMTKLAHLFVFVHVSVIKVYNNFNTKFVLLVNRVLDFWKCIYFICL